MSERLDAIRFVSFLCFLPLGQREGGDDLKRSQLMELALINGTYRDTQLEREFRDEMRSKHCAHA